MSRTTTTAIRQHKSHLYRLPSEILAIIALEVKNCCIFERAPFDFRWALPSPWKSTIENCCYVSKLFYAHFRPHLYASICAETVQYRGMKKQGLFFLEKLHALLEREPQIGPWIKEFRLNLVDELYSDPSPKTDWPKWLSTNTQLPAVLLKLTRLRIFHFFIAHAPVLTWNDFSGDLKDAFAQLFHSKHLEKIDVRSVALPPSLLMTASGVKEMGLWYRVEDDRTWKSLIAAPTPKNKFPPTPDNESLPILHTFSSDDPVSVIPYHLIEAYPSSFQTLRTLRLYGGVTKMERIQAFLDRAKATLKDVNIVLGVNRFLVDPLSTDTHTPLDFSSLQELEKLNLSMHGIPINLPPTLGPALSACLTSLRKATKLQSVDLALTWLCWDFLGGPVHPPHDFSALFRQVDDDLSFLVTPKAEPSSSSSKKRKRRTGHLPKLKPVELRIGCVCHSATCAIHRELLKIHKAADKCLPKLHAGKALKFDVLGRRYERTVETQSATETDEDVENI